MKNTNKIKLFYWLFVTIGLFFVQTIASKIGGILSGLFDYNAIDKDGVFMSISVHHIVQMLFALLLIMTITRTMKLKFYLKPVINKIGIKYICIFTAVILVYVVISYVIGYSIGLIQPYEYELSGTTVTGSLAFQLLLSGTSEEILFRALPISVLLAYGNDENKKKWAVIIIASLLFSVAHISWSLSPFSVSCSLFQLIYAFVLGLVYGVTYIKLKSIIYPMIMHGMSNFLMVGIGYIFMVSNR